MGELESGGFEPSVERGRESVERRIAPQERVSGDLGGDEHGVEDFGEVEPTGRRRGLGIILGGRFGDGCRRCGRIGPPDETLAPRTLDAGKAPARGGNGGCA